MSGRFVLVAGGILGAFVMGALMLSIFLPVLR